MPPLPLLSIYFIMKIENPGNIEPILQKAIRKIRLIAFDFDGVFTDNMVYVLQDGSEAVRCNRSDGIGLQKLNKLGIKTVIISTESNPVVSARAQKLKFHWMKSLLSAMILTINRA